MLRLRWLGRVGYGDALALQRRLAGAAGDHLLLLEHPPTYTLGVRASAADILVPAATVGAEVVRTDRGGQVTYHGPGQLVGYPVMTVPGGGGGLTDTVAWVRSLEQLVIDALGDLGLRGQRRPRHPGVWVGGAKIAAVGVRLARGRSRHGFALNVDPDLSMFDHIVACGLPGGRATSLAAEGVGATMAEVVDAVARRAVRRWGAGGWERQDVTGGPTAAGLAPGPGGRPAGGSPVHLTGRLARAGAGEGMALSTRKPPWLRLPARMGPEFLRVRHTVGGLGLHTVCQEAGCPNIFECWADGTATFMINGERCTRACGFCEVDTRRPAALDPGEPERVAEAVRALSLDHAVITAVARDDLVDGGAGAFAATVAAVRRAVPGCTVEVLIPDCRGDEVALERIFGARPEVCNHNLETVARLQRAVRPSAGYARSLAVLARAKEAGLVTKSGLILGLGETDGEVAGALADLAAVGVDIVTIGQYLRPSARHLPVQRWVEPATFERLRRLGVQLGIGHVEASPLTRSSHRARQSLAAVAGTVQSTAARAEEKAASAAPS
ncbi:MAG TPA: lipoyl synthase [Acidimicrobiales bacterium]|nr:lipoyl synthase [Acidimicrobiales bacterium]